MNPILHVENATQSNPKLKLTISSILKNESIELHQITEYHVYRYSGLSAATDG